MEKKALLIISFGTSYPETRLKTIGATEKFLQQAYPDHDFFRSFTSRMIIKKLKEKYNETIDFPGEVLEKLKKEGYTHVHCQTTHIINGHEYDLTVKELKKYEKDFKEITLGQPLLSTVEDYEEAVEVVMEEMPKLKRGEALLFMGHGTDHHANSTYPCLDYIFKIKDYNDVYVGTVEGFPEIENLIPILKEKKYKKLYLTPFMLVAGDHANNDMASDDDESWKTVLEKEHFKVEPIIRGLGEYKGIQKMFLEHLKKAQSITEM
jgi:sirohydrochlorin cobaltochelatase